MNLTDLPRLYTKTASGAISQWDIWTDGANVCTRWGHTGGATTFVSYVAEPKNVGRANETSASEQAKLEAKSKWDEKIRLKYFTSIEAATTTTNIKPMLAHPLTPARLKKLVPPFSMQPKLNGVRCLAYRLQNGAIRLMSRGGKDYHLPHISASLQHVLPSSIVLDGELYVHGIPLQTARSYIATPSEHSLRVGFHIYDWTPLEGESPTWASRTETIATWKARFKGLQSVHFVDTISVFDVKNITAMHDKAVELGYEGAMIRVYSGVYRMGAKSSELLKVKQFEDAEFTITGWKLGKDGVIVFECAQEEGLTFEVRPRGTEDERAVFRQQAERGQLVGQQLTVRFQERSVDNIPIFPVGISIRPAEDQ